LKRVRTDRSLEESRGLPRETPVDSRSDGIAADRERQRRVACRSLPEAQSARTGQRG
jgi:hypothetical protein